MFLDLALAGDNACTQGVVESFEANYKERAPRNMIGEGRSWLGAVTV